MLDRTIARADQCDGRIAWRYGAWQQNLRSATMSCARQLESTVAGEKEAAKLAELLLGLQEKHGSDVVDLTLWMAPRVPDAIMLGRHEVVIQGVHPQQVDRLIACLNDLNFIAEEVSASLGEAPQTRGDGLVRVVVRW